AGPGPTAPAAGRLTDAKAHDEMPVKRDVSPRTSVVKNERYVVNYDIGALMIRVEQVRTWMESQAERARPWIALVLARLRVLLAVALPWLREKSAVTGAALKGASVV